MSHVLSEGKKQQVIALGKLGWSLRRIEQATGVRRETASAYLKTTGVEVHLPGWGRRAPAKPAIQPTPDPWGKTGHTSDPRLFCAFFTKTPVPSTCEAYRVEAVHLHSHGIPRVINLLCDPALISADLNRIQHVSPLLIGEAAAKFHFHEIKPLAHPLHNSYSTSVATAEVTASQTVIPGYSLASKRSASEVDFPNRISSARSPMSIRILIQPLDRWWSTRAALVAMVRRINPPKVQSDGKLACRIRSIMEWLQAPWSKDRKLVCQIRHLREWLQAPWPVVGVKKHVLSAAGRAKIAAAAKGRHDGRRRPTLRRRGTGSSRPFSSRYTEIA